MDNMSIVVTGDSFISRRLPTSFYSGFNELKNIIERCEFKFTNFEMITPEASKTPSSVSGGTWANADPKVIKDLKKFGFNTMAWANNHTLDFLYEGLYSTRKYLNNEDIIHAGVGLNLFEASDPKFVETSQGRISLISVTTTFHETWKAGEQRMDGPGRPGVNGISLHNIYGIPKEKMETLKEIAEKTYINVKRDLDISEGFLQDSESTYHFGENEFEVTEEFSKIVRPDKDDVSRVIKSIRDARYQSDYVVLSIHTHEMEYNDKSKPAKVIEELSKTFIDEGVDAIIGHGPHVVRGIEIYKKKPIFYSLGNFIFQNDTVDFLPSDFYKKYNLDSTKLITDAINERSKYDTIGLGTNENVWKSVVATWEVSANKVESITLYPISLQKELGYYSRGWPIIDKTSSVLEDIKELSKVYGTEISIQDGIGIIKL